MDPAHALWIGGPQGSGKSSLAAALAERFELQVYHVDLRTWVHEERIGWFVTHSRHRFRLVLEDLRALPDRPSCIVEGPQLFPTSVSAVLRRPDQALFLVPVAAEMEDRLRGRGPMEGTSDGPRARENAVARDLLIAKAFEREARELRLTAMVVDRPLDGMIERAAAYFAPIVERLPRGGDLAAVRAYEEEVRQTQIRLYREWLERAIAAGGTSR